MKKTNKIILIIITTLVLMLSLYTITNATYTPEEFKGQIDTTSDGSENVQKVGGKVVGLIRVVGTIVAVAMITILGIKYMMGSAQERAEYKKTLFPYIVGAVFIFAASNLTQVVYTWAIKL